MQFQVLLNTVVVLIVTSCHAFFKDENETMIYDWQEVCSQTDKHNDTD